MKERDPLSQLLQSWQPKCPIDNQKFAYEVMRRIRQTKKEPSWKRVMANWSEMIGDWLPAPEVVIPIAASLVLLIGVMQLEKVNQQAKQLAALQWHDQLSKPLAKESFAGIYTQLTKQ
jgi:p-aminobenzoyl-glutamate transporter AbgT